MLEILNYFMFLKGMEKLGNNVIKSVFMLCFIVISNILPSVKALNSNKNTLSNSIVLAEKKSSKFYKTKTGKCFHKLNCQYLKHSKIEVSKKEIKALKLKSCSKCLKNYNPKN